MKAVKIKVYGIVQGVGYRAFVYRIANQLKLKGYVKNLEDGSVEIFAEGEEEKINELIEKCKIGPLLAKVEKVEVKEEKPKNYKGFNIIY